MHGGVGKKFLKFTVELGGEGFVVCENQGWGGVRLDKISHGESLAGAGNAEESLLLGTGFQSLGELGDGCGLVASRGVFADKIED